MCRRVSKCSMIRHKAMFPVVVLQGRCTKKHDTRVELLFWLLNPLLLRRPCCLCLPGGLKLPIQCLGARQVGYIFFASQALFKRIQHVVTISSNFVRCLIGIVLARLHPTMSDPLHHLVAWY